MRGHTDDIIITTISKLDRVSILEVISTDQLTQLYVYYQDEVKFVLFENSKPNSDIEDIIKNKPEEEIYMYGFNYINSITGFDSIVERMKELTLVIQRENKLNNLGIWI